MDDETSTSTETEETSQDEATKDETSTDATEVEDGKGSDEKVEEKDTEASLPEWARKELTKTRGEAANYRVKLREVETALKNAKSVEEFEAATATLSEANKKLERALLVSEAARKFNLPDDLAARLAGDTKEELEADAKQLQKYATPVVPENLSGGLDPSDEEDEGDPVKAVAAARASRRRL